MTRWQILWFSGVLAGMTAGMTVRAEPVAAAASACLAPIDVTWLLDQLNGARSQGQSCGGAPKPAAPPLRWEPKLAHSAQAFADELAQRDVLSHVGAAGGSLRARFKRSGYLTARAGENLAAGQEDLDEVLQVWRHSAMHCDNLMQPDFLDVGLACAVGPGAYERYWVMHLGRSTVTLP